MAGHHHRTPEEISEHIAKVNLKSEEKSNNMKSFVVDCLPPHLPSKLVELVSGKSLGQIAELGGNVIHILAYELHLPTLGASAEREMEMVYEELRVEKLKKQVDELTEMVRHRLMLMRNNRRTS